MFLIKYLHIKTVQHNIGNGITEPKLAMTDDNIQIITKLFNGPEGNLVLFNEYFCYRLAILLGIEMPISGICYIDDNTKIFNDNVTENNTGYGFFSTYLIKSIPLMETIIPLITNKYDFYKILLFDHVIFNTDRNAGNLLVRYYKSDISLKVIDHTHVFINQALWDSQCLLRGIKEKDYFSTKILEYNNYLYSMFFSNLSFNKLNFVDLIFLFKEKITITVMEDIIKEIPITWLPKQNDINVLFEYILYRINHLEDICNTIKNYLKS